jgi:hypothetical protein
MSCKKSSKLEKKLAGDLTGGRVQPASGIFLTRRQDVESDVWLCAKSFSIKKEYWKSIKKNAYAEGKLPVMIVRFEPEGEECAIITYSDYLELDKYISKETNGI